MMFLLLAVSTVSGAAPEPEVETIDPSCGLVRKLRGLLGPRKELRSDAEFVEFVESLEDPRLVGDLSLADSQVTGLAPVTALLGLRFLNLRNTRVTDLSPLICLLSLMHLTMVGNSFSDLTPLSGLTRLRYLVVPRTSVADLLPISGLTALILLDLAQTQVYDLNPLRRLTHLKKLILGNTPFSDLTPLADLASLRELIVNETPVSDLIPLAGLVGLEKLFVMKTQVTSLSPLARLSRLAMLDVTGTSVRDIDALESVTRSGTMWNLMLDGTEIAQLPAWAARWKSEYVQVTFLSFTGEVYHLLTTDQKRMSWLEFKFRTFDWSELRIPTLSFSLDGRELDSSGRLRDLGVKNGDEIVIHVSLLSDF